MMITSRANLPFEQVLADEMRFPLFIWSDLLNSQCQNNGYYSCAPQTLIIYIEIV